MQLLDDLRTTVARVRAAYETGGTALPAHLARPQLAPGCEPLGEYHGSGAGQTFLVRRPDGQIISLSPLLMLVAERADGRHSPREIARAVSARCGRRLAATDVADLLEHKLEPVGLLADASGRAPSAERVDPVLALRGRVTLVPAGMVRAASAVLHVLFAGLLAGAALGWLAVFDAWLLLEHGLGSAVRRVAADPTAILGVLGLMLAGTLWHELGHAAACRHGGGRPGRIGAGLFLVWPALYTDVTDAYRLERRARVRTDLGGAYFNALFALAMGGMYALTDFEPLLLVAVLQHVQALQQLLPFARLDGYYVLTDLLGVPDIMGRVGPVLRSMVPGRETDPRARDLPPRVRRVVRVYVLALVAVLVAMAVVTLVHAPAYARTALRTGVVEAHVIAPALHAGQWELAVLAALRILLLVLPAIGLALLAGRLLRASALRSVRRPAIAALALAGGVALALVMAGETPRWLGGSTDHARAAAALQPCAGKRGEARRARCRRHRRALRRRALAQATGGTAARRRRLGLAPRKSRPVTAPVPRTVPATTAPPPPATTASAPPATSAPATTAPAPTTTTAPAPAPTTTTTAPAPTTSTSTTTTPTETTTTDPATDTTSTTPTTP